jgi:hypothetical protein
MFAGTALLLLLLLLFLRCRFLGNRRRCGTFHGYTAELLIGFGGSVVLTGCFKSER